VKPSITINGKTLEEFSDDDLRATAVSAGLGPTNKLLTMAMHEGHLSPVVTTVTLATANRAEILALLVSTAPHKAA
jgi:hypothetical protein